MPETKTMNVTAPQRLPDCRELASCLRAIEAEAEATERTWEDIGTLVRAALLFSSPEPMRPDNADRHMIRWLLQEALNREFELTGSCEVIGTFVDDPNVSKPGEDDA